MAIRKIKLLLFGILVSHLVCSQESWERNTDFADNGYYELPCKDSTFTSYDVMHDSKGDILLLETSQSYTTTLYTNTMKKLNKEGQLVSSFGTDGVVVIPNEEGYRFAQSLLLSDDGWLIARTLDKSIVVYRYDSSGKLVEDWAENGKLEIESISNVPGNGNLFPIVEKKNGELFLFHYFYREELVVYSILGDGSVDNQFGFLGSSRINTNGFSFHVPDFFLDSHGDIFCVDHITRELGDFPEGLIFKVRKEGGLDTSYGEDGWLFLGERGLYSWVAESLIDENDNIFLCGGIRFADSETYFLKIYPNGEIDSAFLENAQKHTLAYDGSYVCRTLLLENDQLSFTGSTYYDTPENCTNNIFGFLDLEGNAILMDDGSMWVEYDWFEYDQMPFGHVYRPADSTIFILDRYSMGKSRDFRKGGYLVTSFKKQKTTSIEQVLKEEIPIFPNPSSGQFTIDNTDGFTEWHLTDLVGRLVEKGQLSSGKNIINTEVTSSGIYLLTIEDKKGKSQSKKVEIFK